MKTLLSRLAMLASAIAPVALVPLALGPAAMASVSQARPPAMTVSPGAPRDSGKTGLTLEIETRHEGGRIAVAIYRDAGSFRRTEDPVRTLMIDRAGQTTRAFVMDLPPGRYAIAAFHDIDGDGRLTTIMGMPREPFGFSNNARGRFGMPTFDHAAFDLPAGGGALRIALVPILH